MPRTILPVFLLILTFWITSCSETNQTPIPTTSELSTKAKEQVHPLMGSWEMKEIHWKTPDTTYSIQEAHPGIFMINSTKQLKDSPTIPKVSGGRNLATSLLTL
ncbi:MAG: hypothetical protein R3E32_07305 [Chitinophagales bacterium]